MASKNGITSKKGVKRAKKQSNGCDCSRFNSPVRLSALVKNKAHREHLRYLAQGWELMTDAITVTEAKSNRLLYVNGSWRRLYGYTHQQALGAKVDDLLNLEGLSAKMRSDIRVKSARGHWCGRLLNRDAQGRIIPVELCTGPVTTLEGEAIGLLGVCTPLRGQSITDDQIQQLVRRHQEILSRELQALLESALINVDPTAHLTNGNGNGHVKPVPGIGRLSGRELEVFTHIGRGLSTNEIAKKLKVSNYTIQTHRNHIRDKMNITDAATLTYRAFQWARGKGAKGKAKRVAL